MINPSITEFLNTIEVMRKAYPFENDDTWIVGTLDYKSAAPNMIELATIDKETGVRVRLTKEVEHE